MNRKRPSIFISHSSIDKERFVSRLAIDLRKAGSDVFYDEFSMKSGDRLQDKISSGIKKCDYFIIVLSVYSVKSSWVKHELDQAMILYIQGNGPRIIPLLIGKVKREDISTDLLGLLYIDFRGGGDEKYRKALGTLLDTLGLVKNMEVHFIERKSSMTTDDIESNLQCFFEKADKGVWSEEEFWKFWDKDTSKSRLFSLLEVASRFVKKAVEKNTDISRNIAYFALERVLAICSKYEIHIKSTPRTLLSLLSSDLSDQFQAIVLEICLALRVTLPTTFIINYLDFSVGMKLYAICEYIEYGGVVVDENLQDRLLKIVESEDDAKFYFIARDGDGNEVEVDAREYAARCLLLIDQKSPSRANVIQRVKVHYPHVVDQEFDITLNAMFNDAIYNQPRKSVDINSVFTLGQSNSDCKEIK